MTPVMARCACPAAYPLVECAKCTPTPPEGLNPDHRQPIKPPPRPPADDAVLTVTLDPDEHHQAADLAAAAIVITSAIVGGGVTLTLGVLEILFGKRHP